MNPALQFLELVDKNAINIFKEFIDQHSIPKIKKSSKPKPLKESKPLKEPKPLKESKPKIAKEPKNAIGTKMKEKYIAIIQNLINEIEGHDKTKLINKKVNKLKSKKQKIENLIL
jgi:hypothetical protein